MTTISPYSYWSLVVGATCITVCIGALIDRLFINRRCARQKVQDEDNATSAIHHTTP